VKSGPRNGHNYTDIETRLQYTPFHFSTIHDQYNFTKVQKYKEVWHSHSLSWTTCDVVINSIVAASCLPTFTVSPLLAGTNLYCLVITGTCVCVNDLPRFAPCQQNGRGSTSRSPIQCPIHCVTNAEAQNEKN